MQNCIIVNITEGGAKVQLIILGLRMSHFPIK